jgi:RNA methyltransferase, TrmH family
MDIEEIKSLKHEKIQLARKLNSQKGREQLGKFLAEGFEAVEWALKAGKRIDFILLSKNADIERYSSLQKYFVSDGLLKKVTDTNYLIPVVAVGNINSDFRLKDFVVVLDDLNDFGNIGTIVRTCHAFGIDTMLSTNKKTDLYKRKTIDASRGKVFGTKLKKHNNPIETIEYLKKNNFQIIAASPAAKKIQSFVTLSDKPVALVVGNETTGVSNEVLSNADLIIQIPMHTSVESLNVGVAAGITIYELKLKQVLGMIEKKIKSTLGREINVAAMLIREVLDKKLKAVSELSSSQLIFMMVLKCDTVMTVPEIQKQFGLADNEISQFFIIPEKRDYIKRESESRIRITERGIETIGKLWAIIENAEEEILCGFTEKEKEELRRLVKKMKTNCVKILEQ